MIRNNHALPERSRGFTLVELMVSILVTLILLAGVLTILLNNRESYTAQQATAELQENVRLASFVLENKIAHAGFRADTRRSFEGVFPATSFSSGPNFAAGEIVAGEHNANASDRLRVRFEGNGGLDDCRGTLGTGTNPQTQTVEFRISGDNALLCENIQTGGLTSLIRNVERFEVRYGLDTNDDQSVDRYKSNLTAAERDQVRSIRVQLLVSSDSNEPFYPTDTQQEFSFMDGDPSSPTTFNDRRARLLLDRTIALRNELP